MYSIGEVSDTSDDNEDDTFTGGLVRMKAVLLPGMKYQLILTTRMKKETIFIMIRQLAASDEEMDMAEANDKETSEADEIKNISHCSAPNPAGTSNVITQVANNEVVEMHEMIACNPGFVLTI